VVFKPTSCNGTSQSAKSKCLDIQKAVRKVTISTDQSSACGAKYIKQAGPKSAQSPYQVALQTHTGSSLKGMSVVWFWHTYLNNTQVAIEVLRAIQFRTAKDDNLDGYELCIKGTGIRGCVLNGSGRLKMATFNVIDHSCDTGALVSTFHNETVRSNNDTTL
jgi:hypothetical protein